MSNQNTLFYPTSVENRKQLTAIGNLLMVMYQSCKKCESFPHFLQKKLIIVFFFDAKNRSNFLLTPIKFNARTVIFENYTNNDLKSDRLYTSTLQFFSSLPISVSFLCVFPYSKTSRSATFYIEFSPTYYLRVIFICFFFGLRLVVEAGVKMNDN